MCVLTPKFKPLPRLLAPQILLACLPLGVLQGQSVRPALRIDPSTQISAGQATAASEGDLSAVVFRRDNEVVVSTSDGRGLTWGSPVRVDLDPTGSSKWVATENGTAPIAIVAGTIFVVWRDARNGADDLWTRNSNDGGQTWGQETRLDKGFGMGTASVREYTLATTSLGGSTHLHVLFSVDPGAAGAFLPDELYLVSSRDSGASWSNAVGVSSANGSGADVDTFALDAAGDDLVMAWSDDRFGSSTNDDLWFRRSLDGGQTFLGLEVQVDPSGPLNGDIENEIALSTEGSLIALAWEEEFGSVREEAWVAISADRGTSLVSAGRVGQYPPATADVDDIAVQIANGVVFAGWDDDRTGTDQVRLIHTEDLGLSWSPERSLSTGQGGDLRFVSSADFVAATWSGDSLGTTGDRARASFSRDAGGTWTTPVDLSSNTGDVDDVRPIWNDLYGNLISPWLADDPGSNGIWVGGFRPQAVQSVNWISGGQASLALSHFSGTTPLVWVLGSSSLGNLPLPLGDGRNLGLSFDATLAFTLQNPASFSTLLGSGGSGSTAPTFLPEPPGTVYYVSAISLKLFPIGLDEISDTLQITVQ